MDQDLALSVLGDIMSWDLERSRQEFAWLQLMSRFKYDSYHDFLAGVRFIERLADWLQQFEKDERQVAYDFVKQHLVYFGNPEIQHLVQLVYPECVRGRLLREVARQVGKPSYMVWSDNSATEVYASLLRRTLFFGLSDGARIDVFRRATSGTISNEQVLLATEIAPEKWNQVLEELRKKQGDDARFRFLFLLDDFVGTGTTLHGKLSRFWRDFSSYKIAETHMEADWDLVVHHYVATKAAAALLPEWDKDTRSQKGAANWFPPVEFSFALILSEELKISETKAGAFWPLIQKYYNSSIETEATLKGGTKDVRMGFGKCALPLVFEHNTPNNSIPLIWAETEGTNGEHAMRPLFRRRQRHS